MVTCCYCEFYKLSYISDIDFYDVGYCRLKKLSKSGLDEICKEFKIKSCVHAKKYYPGKKENQ